MGADRASRRTLFTVTVATIVALGAIGTAVALNNVDGTPSASTTPRGAQLAKPTPGAVPAPAASAPASGGSAATVPVADIQPAVVAFVEQVSSMTPGTDLGAIGKVVTGAALQELQAQQLEFEANGWTVKGQTKVEGVTVLAADPAGAPPTATVQACVDSGDVKILRSDGTPKPDNPDASKRALNIYGLDYVDGTWRVVSHTFPNDPTC